MSGIRIEIQSDKVEERGGTIQRGERAGQSYHIRNQVAWIHNGQAYPEKFVISLQDGQGAYPPGFYLLSSESLEVGEYDRLQFSRKLVLVPDTSAAKAAPARAS